MTSPDAFRCVDGIITVMDSALSCSYTLVLYVFLFFFVNWGLLCGVESHMSRVEIVSCFVDASLGTECCCLVNLARFFFFFVALLDIPPEFSASSCLAVVRLLSMWLRGVSCVGWIPLRFPSLFFLLEDFEFVTMVLLYANHFVFLYRTEKQFVYNIEQQSLRQTKTKPWQPAWWDVDCSSVWDPKFQWRERWQPLH